MVKTELDPPLSESEIKALEELPNKFDTVALSQSIPRTVGYSTMFRDETPPLPHVPGRKFVIPKPK